MCRIRFTEQGVRCTDENNTVLAAFRGEQRVFAALGITNSSDSQPYLHDFHIKCPNTILARSITISLKCFTRTFIRSTAIFFSLSEESLYCNRPEIHEDVLAKSKATQRAIYFSASSFRSTSTCPLESL